MKKTQIKWVICHRQPERSFFYKGKQFPVCARCTGIHLGYFSYPFFLFNFLYFPIAITFLLLIPTILDGLTQAYWDRESNNWLRVTTGIGAGMGLMSLACHIGDYIYAGLVTFYHFIS
jgi:uncharacterized membrane protein